MKGKNVECDAAFPWGQGESQLAGAVSTVECNVPSCFCPLRVAERTNHSPHSYTPLGPERVLLRLACKHLQQWCLLVSLIVPNQLK